MGQELIILICWPNDKNIHQSIHDEYIEKKMHSSKKFYEELMTND